MSPIVVVPWGCQFLLETSGAILAHRKRLPVLAALLAWRALWDLVTFPFYAWDRLHYAAVMWPGRAVQYAILYALALQLAARMIQDYRPLTQYRYKVWAMGASVNVFVFVTTELWEQKFLLADAVSSLLLMAVVSIGWVGRKRRMEEPWRTITVALLLSASGNALCAILSTLVPFGRALFPIPALAALVLWNLSLWPRRTRARIAIAEPPKPLGAIAIGLGSPRVVADVPAPRKAPESVRVPMLSRLVH